MRFVGCLLQRQSVQDLMFTDQPINLINYHKGRFKAKSYLSLCMSDPLCSLFFESSLSHINFMHVGDWWIKWVLAIIKIGFLSYLRSNKNGTHLQFEWSPCGIVFSSMRR